jgi:Flp pilus assembly CpaE family ATPase
LRDLLGVPSERIRFVQNQPTPYGKLSRSELAEILGTQHVVEIPFGGEEVSKAALNGFPVVMSRSANPMSRAIISMARELDISGRELMALSR